MSRFFSVLIVFALLSAGMLFAQETAAPVATDDATVEAAPAAVETAAAEGEASVDLSAMSYDELVAYLSSLDPDTFGIVIADVLNSGDRYLARRVVAAANQILANVDAEKLTGIVTAVEAHGGELVVVQNNTIRVAVPQTNSLLKKFDVPTNVNNSVVVPPSEPTYSAGAAL